MASSNYPFNQDTAFNSFTITDPTVVTGFLGKAYAQSELVPVSYSKLIARGFVDPSIKTFPLQEYVYVSDAHLGTELQEESILPIQSGALRLAMADLYNYWKDFLIGNQSPWSYATPINSPMMVVTPTSCNVTEQGGNFHVILRFNLVVFVLPTSIYAQ